MIKAIQNIFMKPQNLERKIDNSLKIANVHGVTSKDNVVIYGWELNFKSHETLQAHQKSKTGVA